MDTLWNAVTSDPTSFLYLYDANENIDKKTIAKLKKSKNKNDLKLYTLLVEGNRLENKESPIENEYNVPIYTKFTPMKQNINTTLNAVNSPFQRLQADIADLRFTYPGIGPQYALVIVDIFSYFLWTYPMKNRKQLYDKVKIFYEEVWSKDAAYKLPESNERHLQTDMEFNQNRIYSLNKKYNINMFNSKTSQGHAFAAEERVKALKKGITIYLARAKKNKNLQTKNKYKILSDVTQYINNRPMLKYGYSPREALSIFENGPETGKAQKLLARRNLIIEKSYNRSDRYEKRKTDKRPVKLSPLSVGDVVLVESGRIKKSDAVTIFDKATTNKKSAFNKERLFIVNLKIKHKVVLGKTYYLYKLKDIETQETVQGRFKREELYKIK